MIYQTQFKFEREIKIQIKLDSSRQTIRKRDGEGRERDNNFNDFHFLSTSLASSCKASSSVDVLSDVCDLILIVNWHWPPCIRSFQIRFNTIPTGL